MRELIFSAELSDQDTGILDGPCELDAAIPWPSDKDSTPLFHLLSLPLAWLEDPQFNSKRFKWLSIFVSYDKATYSHYGKMSSDEPDHAEAQVIVHGMSGTSRSQHPSQASVSKKITTRAANENDDNVASHIGGAPSWVQDPIAVDGYKWVLSIYGPDMDEALGENRGIFSDGVGYVFLKTDLEPDALGVAGKFFLQLG
jgi:hypothetical protein